MTVGRPQEGNRAVMRATQHQRHASFRECNQNIIGIGKAMRIRHDSADVVKRDAPQFRTGLTDDKKTAVA